MTSTVPLDTIGARLSVFSDRPFPDTAAPNMYEQALEAHLKSQSIGGAKPEELSTFRAAYQKSGIGGYWRQVRAGTREGSETCSMLQIYGRLGETDQIIDYLNWAFRNHCPSIRTLKVDSFYDNLRGDPRFKDVVTRLNL